MRYFQDCNTPAEVKTLYRKLAFQHHPDHGGDTETMKQVNSQYQEALSNLNGYKFKGTDGKERTYRYNATVEKEAMNKIYELLALKMQGVTIELIGTWVWIHGNTKPYKEELKGLKCRWHSKRVKWYWHNKNYRTRYANCDFNTLRHTYGVAEFDSEFEERKHIQAAS